MRYLLILLAAAAAVAAASDDATLPLSASCTARLERNDGKAALVIRDAGRERVHLNGLPGTVALRRAGDMLHLDGTQRAPLHFRDLCTYPMN